MNDTDSSIQESIVQTLEKIAENADDDLYIAVSEYEDGEQIPIWDGESVEHVFRSGLGFNLDSCPRCSKFLSRKYVGLLYSSFEDIRQHVGPSAAICDDCQIAVVDESLIEQTALENDHDYGFPLAVFNFEKGPPSPDNVKFFASYEGHAPVFCLNEDGEVEGLVYKDDYQLWMQQRKAMQRESDKKLKAKRKKQKESRKRNRGRS